MPIDVAKTIAGLELLKARVDHATERIVVQAAHAYQAKAMIFAPVGEADNSTNEPGDLRRSIIATDPEGGGGRYLSRVGPTVITANPGPGGSVFNYGRQREFGGLLWAKASLYLAFQSHGLWARKLFVYQFGSHYLLRARMDTDIGAIIDANLTVAIEGG